MRSSSSLSIAIVGAGVFGATAAIELKRRRHDVYLFDPGPLPHPDASSTDISKAVRMDYGSDAFYAALAEEAIEGWRGWNRQWGVPLYHEVGVLFLSRSTLAPDAFEHKSFELLRGRGHALERIGAEALRRRFPAWNPDRYEDGYFNPTGGWVESGRVVARLLHDARGAGVVLHEGERVASLLDSNERVVGVETATGVRHRFDVVVVAAGAWTQVLLPQLAGRLTAVAQPVLHFRPADPSLFLPPRFSVWCADIARTGWYGFPATAEGIVKVAHHGPGHPIDPTRPRVFDSEAEPRFRAFLRESLPALADAPVVFRRMCLYEDSIDGDFWIDHDPDRPGVVVAAGGSGHGFKFAPVLGPIIADVVERAPNPHAARFAWRRPEAPMTEQARSHGEQGREIT